MIPKINRYPALLIHKCKHGDSYYLIDSKEKYLNTLFYIFKDIYEMQKHDYGFVRNINIDLFNQEEAEKFPWRYWESIQDISTFYVESYELAMEGKVHPLVEGLEDKKFIDPSFWRNSCLVFLFKYFGEEIEIENFEKV